MLHNIVKSSFPNFLITLFSKGFIPILVFHSDSLQILKGHSIKCPKKKIKSNESLNEALDIALTIDRE